MSKGRNQKLKLIYLIIILYENTDDMHSLTMTNILHILNEYGIEAERKSIYADLEALRNLGIDIIGEKRGRTYYYHIGNRRFELAELKLLVDAVQASRFITTKKSRELINKLEGLTSKYEAKQLQRQVYVAERIKTMNESIYYNVDKIHTAISTDVKICFQYFQWNLKKEMELRRNGQLYCISPWALTWTDENYYLIGYDSEADKIKHYRVDKMLKIETTNMHREGKEYFEHFNMAVYTKKIFGMFDGEEESVILECENRFIGVMIDRFGKDITVVKKDEEHFTVNVEVAVSGQFLGWIFALGDGVKVVGPECVVERMRDEIRRLQKRYL
ncbi:MAG: helix-turn-helix transcriptional regulator [Lachnospiraceae bacterium]